MISNKIIIISLLVYSIMGFNTQAQNRSNTNEVIELFEIEKNNSLKSEYFTNEIEGEILSLNHQNLHKLMNDNHNSFILKLPVEGENINLTMKKSSFIVDGANAKAMNSKFETNLDGRGIHYWGFTEDSDDQQPLVAFSFFEDQVFGIFWSDFGNYNLIKLNDASDSYAFYKYTSKFEGVDCANEEKVLTKEIKKNLNRNTQTTGVSLLDYPIEISMNANNCVINSLAIGNGSTSNTINLILSHFNFYSLIFANEEISIKISEIVLEDLGHSGVGDGPCFFANNATSNFFGPGMLSNNNSCSNAPTNYLQQFQNILGNSYIGDFAYMYVNNSCDGFAGKAAQANGAFCNETKTSRMAVGISPNQDLSNFELPDFNGRLGVFPHELGHLLGASHNFCSNTPYFNIMLSGGGSCYEIDKNFRRGFGVEKGNDIRNNIANNISCYTESNICEQNDLYVFHRIEDIGTEDYSAYYKAQNIVADNLILNNSEVLYSAESAIELIPGFEVEENSEFEARIEDCSTSIGRESYKNNEGFSKMNDFLVVPTVVENMILIENKNRDGEQISMTKIYDLFGVEVFKDDKINTRSISYNLGDLSKGFYILKVFGNNGEILHTQKIVKK